MSVQLKFKVVDKTYTPEILISKYREIIFNAIKDTKTYTINWIHKFVPKRTGQLRDNLIEWINNHWMLGTMDRNTIIDLVTNIEYATDMTGDVVHTGTWYEHSGAPAMAFYYGYNGRIFLDDPTAIINWYFIIEDFVREELTKNITIYKDYILGG